LHAFGDDVDAGAAGQADDGLHDGQVVGVVGQAGDEAAVEFEYVDRQALEVGQRGVTGAEVVQGDGDAEGAQAGEGLGGDFDVGKQGAFGQLQTQARGRQAACGGEKAVKRCQGQLDRTITTITTRTGTCWRSVMRCLATTATGR